MTAILLSLAALLALVIVIPCETDAVHGERPRTGDDGPASPPPQARSRGPPSLAARPKLTGRRGSPARAPVPSAHDRSPSRTSRVERNPDQSRPTERLVVRPHHLPSPREVHRSSSISDGVAHPLAGFNRNGWLESAGTGGRIRRNAHMAT